MFALIFLMCVIVILIWYNNNDDEGSWEFETKVVKGNGTGRKIDWSTANLETPPPHIKEHGLYACMSNYGQATLFKHTNGRAEVHIHKFNKDIYDQTIKLKNFEKHITTIEIIDRN